MTNYRVFNNIFPQNKVRDLAIEIINRIDTDGTVEEITNEIDEEIDLYMAFPENQWIILEAYTTPLEPDYGFALESFTRDVAQAIFTL